MPSRGSFRALLAVATLVAASAPGLGQYDRDGRYVPSPMGVPADPQARTVPLYPGTPGRVTGTPMGDPYQPPPPLAPMTPRLPEPTTRGESLPIPLTRAQCEEGWSKETGVPRVEFRRRCARMTKR